MIGDKIILYRKRKGLTQEELADLLEVSRQTVTKWESGSVLPNLDYIMGLSVIFGITIDNLVKDNDCAKQEIESKISNYNWIDYYGKVLDEAFSGDFLKEALLLVDRISPFRGPALYTNGNYTYHCSYDGDYEFFNGKEEIYYNNIKVYECLFHGGSVK